MHRVFNEFSDWDKMLKLVVVDNNPSEKTLLIQGTFDMYEEVAGKGYITEKEVVYRYTDSNYDRIIGCLIEDYALYGDVETILKEIFFKNNYYNELHEYSLMHVITHEFKVV